MAKGPIREPGHMSQAQYARHRGCGRADVLKALKAGRIHVEKDGAIDPKRADREWAASVNPASGKRPHMKPGESTLSAKPGGGRSSFADARVRSELAKARMAELRIQEKEGQLVDVSFAKKAAFAFTRQFRDRLQGWPSRNSALMANELGVDAHLLETILDGQVRDLLRSMAADIDPEAFAASLERSPRKVSP